MESSESSDSTPPTSRRESIDDPSLLPLAPRHPLLHFPAQEDTSSLSAEQQASSLHQYTAPGLAQSPSHSRKTSSSSIGAFCTIRRSRYLDSSPPGSYAEPSLQSAASASASASVAASQPSTLSIRASRSKHSRTHSAVSDTSSDVLVFGELKRLIGSLRFSADFFFRRCRVDKPLASLLTLTLADPAFYAQSSLSDFNARRLSSTSIYSLASARGILNSSSSVHGSDSGVPPRSFSGPMSSNKGANTSTAPEPGLSNVTAATSSSSGPIASGQHNLVPRDPHPQPLDLIRRNQRPEANMRSQPDRSRSRAKRRCSGSTATSIHSQGSDRGPYREKEEGTVMLLESQPKPAQRRRYGFIVLPF